MNFYDHFWKILKFVKMNEYLYVEKETVHRNNSVLCSMLDNNMSINIKGFQHINGKYFWAFQKYDILVKNFKNF